MKGVYSKRRHLGEQRKSGKCKRTSKRV